jgi:hypothetical protein
MTHSAESQILERIVPELKAEGYEVFVQPNRLVLPAFFGDYIPDAIALRSDKNLVVEITSRSKSTPKRLAGIQSLLRGHKDWELKIFYLSSNADRELFGSVDPALIQKRIREVEEIIESGNTGAAMLLCWAILEAWARFKFPKTFEKPQTPGRIVSILASEGIIRPSEADFVRTLVEKRNRLIHGGLQVEVSKSDANGFVKFLNRLSELPSDLTIQ